MGGRAELDRRAQHDNRRVRDLLEKIAFGRRLVSASLAAKRTIGRLFREAIQNAKRSEASSGPDRAKVFYKSTVEIYVRNLEPVVEK